jgi:transcriptional regulator with XRE-family HTH domain
MTETEFDFAVLAANGVSQADFASLVGVSRVTVNLWCNGKRPGKFLVDRVHRLLDAVRKAGELGKLPLHKPRRQDATDRHNALKSALGIA